MSSNYGPEQVRHPFTGELTDAAFLEILRCFTDELPGRIRSLESAMERLDLGAIQTMAHQLKGCAAGYGFPELGDRAAVLEESLSSVEQEPDQLAQIRSEFDALLALCRSYCNRV